MSEQPLQQPPSAAAAATLPGVAPRLTRRGAVSGAIGLGSLAGAMGLGALLHELTATHPDARQQAAHLLRRAGFAPAPTELDAVLKAGLKATTDTLLHPEGVDDSALEARLSVDNFDLTRVEDLRRWWLVRMAVTRRPLLEKMTLFWHGLLTSSYRKVGKERQLMATQNQFLRQHALGNLRDLLVGISKDGAMLHWLDGTGSTRTHPNENYARELMELFTMGVGNYTETDVRELARALTGWYVDPAGAVKFRPGAHDNGPKTFLGHTGNLGLEEAVDAILAQPATPRHLAARMWEFFVYPAPSDADLRPLVDAYHRSHYDIRAMMEALLGSPRFFSGQAYRGLVKSPAELVAGVARQFTIPLDANAFIAMEAMGQALFDPPNVAGWPAGPGWLSTGSWMARMRWLLSLSATSPGQHVEVRVAGKVAEAVERGSAVMIDGNLSAGARDAITQHLLATSGARRDSDLFFLLASSPEYQLA